MQPKTNVPHDLPSLAARLDALTEQVSYLVEQQRRQDEFISEMMPIARLAMGSASTRLAALEKDGYFAFGQEALRVGQRIVESYGPADVRAFGEAIVGILDTVRALTQPEVLRIAGEATAALASADEAEPMGLVGMVRASRDEDVQKGMAVLMELLRHVGRGARAVAEKQSSSPAQSRRERLAAVTAARRPRGPLGVERPAPRASASAAQAVAASGAPGGCAVPSPGASEVAATIDGVGFTADGHLADPSAWTRELAQQIAGAQGVTMSEAHWKLVELARADFEQNHVSPNIRRLTLTSALSTRDLYALFPRAPARTIAKIAGLPKPAGCL